MFTSITRKANDLFHVISKFHIKDQNFAKNQTNFLKKLDPPGFMGLDFSNSRDP